MVMTELVLSALSVGTISTTAAYFVGKIKGKESAIDQARAEYNAKFETEIQIRELDDHYRRAEGHVCGTTCFENMKLDMKIQRYKNNEY